MKDLPPIKKIGATPIRVTGGLATVGVLIEWLVVGIIPSGFGSRLARGINYHGHISPPQVLGNTIRKGFRLTRTKIASPTKAREDEIY